MNDEPNKILEESGDNEDDERNLFQDEQFTAFNWDDFGDNNDFTYPVNNKFSETWILL